MKTSMYAAPHNVQKPLFRVFELLSTIPPRGGESAAVSDDVLETIAERSRRAGLEATYFEGPAHAAIEAIGRDRPILVLDSSGKPLLLSKRLGGWARAESFEGRATWLDATKLADRLGLDEPGQEATWLAIRPQRETRIPLAAKRSPWRDAWAVLKGETGNIGALVVYAASIGLLSLALPLAVQILVNTVAFGQLLQPIVFLAILLGAALIFAAVLRAMSKWMVELLQRRIFVRLVSELSHRLPRLDAHKLRDGKGPSIVNRFFDIFIVQSKASSLLLGGVDALLTVVVGLIVLAFYHPILLGFGVVLFASAFVIFVVMARGASETAVAESKAKYAVASWLEDVAHNVDALKMAGGDAYAVSKLDSLASKWLHARENHFRLFFRQYVGALMMQVVAHATLLGVGGALVVNRQLTIGQLVAAELIVTTIAASLAKLGKELEILYDLTASSNKVGDLLSVAEEADDGVDLLEPGEAASLALLDISDEEAKIAELRLAVPAGQRVGITCSRRQAEALSDFLFGYRRPESGVVMIDDHDIRDVRNASVRSAMSVVGGPAILPGTIVENLRAVGREVAVSELYDALQAVGVYECVAALPDGMRTPLLPTGRPLTHLDSVRLTLARAILSRPAILVLDGTLDLFPRAERQELLDTLSEGRTLIVMTHDKETANLFDRCIDLSQPRAEGGQA